MKQIMFKQSVSTASANTQRLMICGEIIAVYSDNYTKHINNSKQNVNVFNIKCNMFI